MKRILVIGLLLSQVFLCQAIVAQEVKSDSTKIEEFNRKKEQIIQYGTGRYLKEDYCTLQGIWFCFPIK